MTDTQVRPTTAASDFSIDTHQLTLKESWRNYLARFKGGGELGLAPAGALFVVLFAFFAVRAPDQFFTAFNMGNLVTQAASICILAMGVTFVLLLGEIDLAAGYTAGVCAAIMAARLRADDPLWLVVIYSVAAAIAIGMTTGWLVAKVGIPSFIVTLSFFLSWQGVLLLITKEGGTIRVENDIVVALANDNLSVAMGWVLWAVLTFGFLGGSLWKAATRRRSGLPAEPVALIAIKTVAIGACWGVFTWVLSGERGNGLTGVPIAAPLVLGVMLVLTLLLGRTSWGRHIYAVGGNAEAARRAGINIVRIKMSAFVMTSVLACLAGYVLASRINSVDPQTGGNDTLLIAIGAAVIGGTSLFGGRGRMVNAVAGGLVFALINNGLSFLGEVGPINFSDAGPKFLVNGVVLLAFASLDAVSRRRSAAT